MPGVYALLFTAENLNTRYKEMKDVNANSVYDREIAAYYNRINGWNDFEQAQILCQLIDEAEKIISSNLPVSQSFRTMITVGVDGKEIIIQPVIVNK